MHTHWQNVRYGLRMLANNHDFRAVAILTLPKGIGDTTDIFSLTYQILLRQLHVKHPGAC